MKPLRVVLYARVSTDTGEQDPEAQLHALRPWCERRGWAVVGEKTDRVTGDPVRRKGDPPGLREALALIEERRAEVLAIFSADRLVRSPWEMVKLVARIQSVGGQVASYQDGADLDTTTDEGEFALFMKGWFARMFLRLNRKMTKAGLARAVARGVRLGRPPLCGACGLRNCTGCTRNIADELARLEAEAQAGGRPAGYRTLARLLGCSEWAVRCAKNPGLKTRQRSVGNRSPEPGA